MIEFQNVSVCYNPGARHPASAIENISLKIGTGEWVFLVGPSGAGKSTLLKLLHCSLAGAARVEGRIFLDKREITHLPAREIPFVRRKIGVIFQDFQLLAQKTAWENVAFALRVIGTPQARIAREVPRALDIVGLAHRAHAQPHELSGGEQQRIAIARAIVNEPALLLADEPTGNLDPDTAAGIAEVLRRINEECGTTVVMATHDRHLVDTMRRRVVRVRDGKIASDEAQGVYHPEDDEPAPAGKWPPADGTPAGADAVAKADAVNKSATANGAARSVLETNRTPKPAIPKPAAPPLARERIEVREAAGVAPVSATGNEASTPAPSAAPPVTSQSVPPVAPSVVTSVTSQDAPSAVPEKSRMRLAEPQDAITREALVNTAPLGSDENPIVQYGKR